MKHIDTIQNENFDQKAGTIRKKKENNNSVNIHLESKHLRSYGTFITKNHTNEQFISAICYLCRRNVANVVCEVGGGDHHGKRKTNAMVTVPTSGNETEMCHPIRKRTAYHDAWKYRNGRLWSVVFAKT